MTLILGSCHCNRVRAEIINRGVSLSGVFSVSVRHVELILTERVRQAFHEKIWHLCRKSSADPAEVPEAIGARCFND